MSTFIGGLGRTGLGTTLAPSPTLYSVVLPQRRSGGLVFHSRTRRCPSAAKRGGVGLAMFTLGLIAFCGHCLEISNTAISQL